MFKVDSESVVWWQWLASLNTRNIKVCINSQEDEHILDTHFLTLTHFDLVCYLFLQMPIQRQSRETQAPLVSLSAILQLSNTFFQGHTGQGLWTIIWAVLLCIQFICQKHYEHLVWTKTLGTMEQQQTGKASAKVSIHKAVRGKRGHCTLLKVTALPKMGPL